MRRAQIDFLSIVEGGLPHVIEYLWNLFSNKIGQTISQEYEKMIKL